MTTAQQEWLEFAEKVGLNSPQTPEVQRTEMRRAFFAGQLSMFTFQMTEMCKVSDNEAMRMIAARERELKEFFGSNFQKRN